MNATPAAKRNNAILAAMAAGGLIGLYQAFLLTFLRSDS